MSVSDEYERVQPETRAAWRRWLAKHHDSAPGAWVVSWRRATGRESVPYDEIVEEALCFGWIDGTRKVLDAERSMLLLTPRKPKSTWAASNKARVERLIAAGRMRPAGLAKIEAARRDGSWSALDTIDALEVPDDLRRALGRNAAAWKHFEAFPPTVKKGFLWWIASAKRPETRVRRVASTVERAAANIRLPG